MQHKYTRVVFDVFFLEIPGERCYKGVLPVVVRPIVLAFHNRKNNRHGGRSKVILIIWGIEFMVVAG